MSSHLWEIEAYIKGLEQYKINCVQSDLSAQTQVDISAETQADLSVDLSNENYATQMHKKGNKMQKYVEIRLQDGVRRIEICSHVLNF